MGETVHISLDAGGDLSGAELEELTAAVRRELLRLDVDRVDRIASGEPPAGTRGVDIALLGQLLVELGGAGPVLGQVVAVVQAWALRSPQRTATLTIGGDTLELAGLSLADQQQVIADWMARHPRPAG